LHGEEEVMRLRSYLFGNTWSCSTSSQVHILHVQLEAVSLRDLYGHLQHLSPTGGGPHLPEDCLPQSSPSPKRPHVQHNHIPQTLVQKLTTLGLSFTLCNWVLDFLTDRPQSVRIHDVSSSSISLSTGSPQGCVLSPLLFTLLTHDCSAIHPSCLIVKFADDTAVVGRIANWQRRVRLQAGGGTPGGLVQAKQPLHQREEDQGDDRGLQKGQTPPLPPPLHIGGTAVEVVSSFRRLRRAGMAGELSPDLLLQMCGGERPVLLHHRVARQLLGGREEGSAEGGEGCTEDCGGRSSLPTTMDIYTFQMQETGLLHHEGPHSHCTRTV
ncbi:hypothetical protein L3Q82_020533, partial [Scortum barcoo]